MTQPVGTSIFCHDDQPVGQCANLQFTDSSGAVNVCCEARFGAMTNYILDGQSSCEQCELLDLPVMQLVVCISYNYMCTLLPCSL